MSLAHIEGRIEQFLDRGGNLRVWRCNRRCLARQWEDFEATCGRTSTGHAPRATQPDGHWLVWRSERASESINSLVLASHPSNVS